MRHPPCYRAWQGLDALYPRVGRPVAHVIEWMLQRLEGFMRWRPWCDHKMERVEHLSGATWVECRYCQLHLRWITGPAFPRSEA